MWIGDESQHDINIFDTTDSDFDESSESWLTDNMNVRPDTGGSEENDSEKPKTSVDLEPDDPEDVVWIDDYYHNEPVSGTFSSEPSASVTFVQDGDEESEGTYGKLKILL